MEKAFHKLELINDVPIALLDDPTQRELYKQKLRNEVASYKAKEKLYEEKRSSLRGVEDCVREGQ